MKAPAVLFGFVFLTAACSPVGSPTLSDQATTTIAGSANGVTEVTVTTTAPEASEQIVLRVPAPYVSASVLAADLSSIELQIRSGAADIDLETIAHRQQRAYRQLSYTAAWHDDVLAAVDPTIRTAVELNLDARLQFLGMQTRFTDRMPDWTIIEPEPADALLSYYQAAEAATGIEWEYLAAINLVETGMGRISGVSSANAQGPMQFLPTTWEEQGIGAGDITDPNDSIQAAARYLVRRGGPDDMQRALWGYNNHDNYVAAVMNYAEIMRTDPAAYDAFHAWEIYFLTSSGDLLLPVGYSRTDRLLVTEWIAAEPGYNAPDDGSLDHVLGGRRAADAPVAPGGCELDAGCNRIGVYTPLNQFSPGVDMVLELDGESIEVFAGTPIPSERPAGELLQVGYHDLAPGFAFEVVSPAGNPFAAEEMTLRSFAGLRPGFTVAETEAALGTTLVIEATEFPGCMIALAAERDPYAPLLYFYWDGDDPSIAILHRVLVTDQGVSTPSGARVGTTADELRAIYGDQLDFQGHPQGYANSAQVHFVPSSPEDAAFRLVFDVVDGVVRRMWTSTLEKANVDRGCYFPR